MRGVRVKGRGCPPERAPEEAVVAVTEEGPLLMGPLLWMSRTRDVGLAAPRFGALEATAS